MQSISKNIRPRVVLDEWLYLDVAQIDELDRIVLMQQLDSYKLTQVTASSTACTSSRPTKTANTGRMKYYLASTPIAIY